jgi:hypothetical protein
VDDAYANRRIEATHDLGHLRRYGRDDCGASIGSMRKPVLANWVVHATRDDVRSAAQQSSQIGAVDTAAIVRVHECGIARCASHRNWATADLANFDAERADSRRESSAPSRHEYLADVAGGETADQQLGLALTAAITARGIDVGNARCHREAMLLHRFEPGGSVAQQNRRQGVISATLRRVNQLPKVRGNESAVAREEL